MNGMALCAGAGGLELGLHLALGDAYRTVVGVEWEASAASVLVARQQDGALPPFPIWDSVATFDGRPWRGVVDIVSGGFPCQPFSVAGKRGGDLDPRHLWPHIARIIGECQPRYVFLENVPGLLTTPLADGRGFAYELVEADLHELGYVVASGLFTAAEVGAPHQRERLFILGMAAPGIGQLSEPWRGAQERNGTGPAGAEPDMDNTIGARCEGGERPGAPGEGSTARRAVGESGGLGTFPPGPGDRDAWQRILAVRPDLAPATQSEIRGVADGLETRVDLSRTAQLRITGNGVVPQCASFAFRTLWRQLGYPESVGCGGAIDGAREKRGGAVEGAGGSMADAGHAERTDGRHAG